MPLVDGWLQRGGLGCAPKEKSRVVVRKLKGREGGHHGWWPDRPGAEWWWLDSLLGPPTLAVALYIGTLLWCLRLQCCTLAASMLLASAPVAQRPTDHRMRRAGAHCSHMFCARERGGREREKDAGKQKAWRAGARERAGAVRQAGREQGGQADSKPCVRACIHAHIRCAMRSQRRPGACLGDKQAAAPALALASEREGERKWAPGAAAFSQPAIGIGDVKQYAAPSGVQHSTY